MNLAIVIPVYNEKNSIERLIRDLHHILNHEKITHTYYIINDGSTDGSEEIMKNLQSSIPGITLISGKNCGHGPSLLKGYHLALNHEWVFQLDSDYQYNLSTLIELWKARENYDFLVGIRKGRVASISRNLITAVSNSIVFLLYGRGLKDVNTPYRLLRSKLLAKALKTIDSDKFAPNILISAYFIKNKLRIYSLPTELKTDATLRKSKMNKSIFKGSIKSVLDLMIYRTKI